MAKQNVPKEGFRGPYSGRPIHHAYGVAYEATRSPVKDEKSLGRGVPHPDDPPQPRHVDGPIGGIGQRVDLLRRGDWPQGEVYDRLRRLKELWDEGHITEEEYAAK